MKSKTMLTIATAAAALATAAGTVVHAQDKYTLKVPGGLAFSEFKGYEGWEVIAFSQYDKLVAVILGNPAMMDAFSAGFRATASRSPMAPRWRRFDWIPTKNASTPRSCR